MHPKLLKHLRKSIQLIRVFLTHLIEGTTIKQGMKEAKDHNLHHLQPIRGIKINQLFVVLIIDNKKKMMIIYSTRSMTKNKIIQTNIKEIDIRLEVQTCEKKLDKGKKKQKFSKFYLHSW